MTFLQWDTPDALLGLVKNLMGILAIFLPIMSA